MRAAPAVWAPLDDCRPERVLIALLYGAMGAALAAWAEAHGLAGDAMTAAAPLLGLALASTAGLHVARRLLPGDMAALGWDGQAWSLQQRGASLGVQGTTPVADLQWRIDLGPWLLARARCAAGPARWLVLRQRSVGPAWHLLRVALTAHAATARRRP